MIFNLVLQLGIGLGLEMVHGTIRVMILYVLGVREDIKLDHTPSLSTQVLAGSLSFFCFDCGSLLGASGGKLVAPFLVSHQML